MAQPQPNEFTEILFSDTELDNIFASFTDAQLQLLQNYRAQAARNNIQRTFDDKMTLDTQLREHAYQLGRMDLVTDVISEVAAARQRLAASAASSNSTNEG